jgi:hypothetical protein
MFASPRPVRIAAATGHGEWSRRDVSDPPSPRLRRDKGNLLKGAKAETGVVVLNDAMISEFFESRPTALSDE